MPLSEVPNSKLGLGSMVEVQLKNAPSLYGVIQWIGLATPENLNSCLVGVELEDEPPESVQVALSDGVYSGVRCFRCPPNRAIFIAPSKCTKDRRFQDQPSSSSKGATKQVDNYKMFGQKDCPVVPGFVPPLSKAVARTWRRSQPNGSYIFRNSGAQRPGKGLRQVQGDPGPPQLVLFGRNALLDVYLHLRV